MGKARGRRQVGGGRRAACRHGMAAQFLSGAPNQLVSRSCGELVSDQYFD